MISNGSNGTIIQNVESITVNAIFLSVDDNCRVIASTVAKKAVRVIVMYSCSCVF